MTTVLLVIHTLIAIGLVGLILLQKSEGGALGIGGGGGGGLMSGRGAATVLTRGTSILGAAFFATSIGLALLAGIDTGDETVIQQEAQNQDVLGFPVVPEEEDDPFALPDTASDAPAEPQLSVDEVAQDGAAPGESSDSDVPPVPRDD